MGNSGGLSNTPKLSPMCSASVSPRGLKNDECYICSALVSPHGLKNDECYMCNALVSRHGFKSDIHFMCSALVSPHGWEIFSLPLANWPPKSPIDSCRDELSPSDPIESVCQHLQPLLLLLTSYFRYHAPCAHFWFRSQSDSIRLLVKTTRLRSGVLDVCGEILRNNVCNHT